MRNKRILLGISGGIAAYKVAFLIRLFKKAGAEVKCIMTPASSDFISPLVVSTLSENPVAIEFWNKSTGEWTNHVDLALWADVFVLAPATANTISKMAQGQCDNLLLATFLSLKTQSIIAPAMDLDMYAHSTTKRNLEQLKADGVSIIPAEEGPLASGLIGTGRMAEPEIIFDFTMSFFESKEPKVLQGKRVLITAGPTYESIDPVRFIGNHSSGKMGYEIAENVLRKGAEVVLISGPTKLHLSHPNLKLISVFSAEEMLQAVQEEWNAAHIGIFAAAVADYRPMEKVDQKIKKSDDALTLQLVKNPDILHWAGTQKEKHQTLIGFALETNDAMAHAAQKLQKKNLDFIVVNTLEDEGAGFSTDTNKITLLDRNNKTQVFELKTKREVANDIIEYLITFIEQKS